MKNSTTGCIAYSPRRGLPTPAVAGCIPARGAALGPMTGRSGRRRPNSSCGGISRKARNRRNRDQTSTSTRSSVGVSAEATSFACSAHANLPAYRAVLYSGHRTYAARRQPQFRRRGGLIIGATEAAAEPTDVAYDRWRCSRRTGATVSGQSTTPAVATLPRREWSDGIPGQTGAPSKLQFWDVTVQYTSLWPAGGAFSSQAWCHAPIASGGSYRHPIPAS